MTIWNRMDWDKKLIAFMLAAAIAGACAAVVLMPKKYVPPVAVAPPIPTSVVQVEPVPTSTSWSKCVTFTGRPIDKKNYEIILQNHCGTTLDDFNVLFRFYDTAENRIGWADQNIASLEVGERVRWRSEYPIKEYPLTAEGVGSIKVSSYGAKGKE